MWVQRLTTVHSQLQKSLLSASNDTRVNELLGNQGVTDSNIMQYLGVIEQVRLGFVKVPELVLCFPTQLLFTMTVLSLDLKSELNCLLNHGTYES